MSLKESQINSLERRGGVLCVLFIITKKTLQFILEGKLGEGIIKVEEI